MEGVPPGAGPFDGRLNGSLLALVRDAVAQAALVQQTAGLVGVIAGAQVHGDVVGLILPRGQYTQAARSESAWCVYGRRRRGVGQ